MAFGEGGYTSSLIKMKGITYGKGTAVSVAEGLKLVEQQTILEAYAYATIEGYKQKGITRFSVHRGSTYDCSVCDEVCARIYSVNEIPIPVHVRCCCYTVPIEDGVSIETRHSTAGISGSSKPSGPIKRIILTEEQKAHRKELQREAIAKFKGMEVENVVKIKITATGIKEYLNQPHGQYFEKNELVKDLPTLIMNAKYEKSIPYHKDNDYFVSSHLLSMKIHGKINYLIAREDRSGNIILYSISDNTDIVNK